MCWLMTISCFFFDCNTFLRGTILGKMNLCVCQKTNLLTKRIVTMCPYALLLDLNEIMRHQRKTVHFKELTSVRNCPCEF